MGLSKDWGSSRGLVSQQPKYGVTCVTKSTDSLDILIGDNQVISSSQSQVAEDMAPLDNRPRLPST
jgi:hypothetical protein